MPRRRSATGRGDAPGAPGSPGRGDPAGPLVLAVLPLRTAVVLPGEQVVLPVGRAPSVAAVRAAQADGALLLCPQRDPQCELPSPADLWDAGTVARLLEVEPEGEGLRIAVQARWASRWSAVAGAGQPLRAVLAAPEAGGPYAPPGEMAQAAEWLWQQVRTLPEFGSAETPEAAGLPAPLLSDSFLDAVAARLLHGREERLELLRARDGAARLQVLHRLLLPRLPRPTDAGLARRTVRQMQEEQRRYVLLEQLRAIRHELGDDQEGDAERWRTRLQAAELPPAALEAGLREAARLERLPPLSSEAAIARTYLDWLEALPWARWSPERADLAAARRVLDAQHHGLLAVKERILEHLAVHLLRQRRLRAGEGAPAAAGTALCLAGPPGIGKTSLARSMAEALGRPFVRVALGGVRDEAELRGHRRTYVGALPGRILAGMRRAAAANPVMLLDELDKLGGEGGPAAALLEVLDPEQQAAFSDHYLEVPFDLSQVMFVATANDVSALPPPLRDRLEVVQLPPYAPEEKAAIALQHLLPHQLALHALPPGSLAVTEAAVRALVRAQAEEPGVRALERQLAALCRRAARQVLEEPQARLRVTAANLGQWLRPAPPPER